MIDKETMKMNGEKLVKCETCDEVFPYVPQKRFCTACKKRRRYLRQKDYAKRDYVIAKRKTAEAISKKKAYDYARRNPSKGDEE